MILGANGTCNYWEDSVMNSTQNASISLLNQSNELNVTNSEVNRLSNTDSGFVSISQRSSGYSKRSSQQSTISSQWSSKLSSSTVTEIMKSENIIHKSFNATQSQMRTELNFKQNTSSSSAHSSFVTSRDEVDQRVSFDDTPPAIPQKTRKKQERQPSPYDNVPDESMGE